MEQLQFGASLLDAALPSPMPSVGSTGSSSGSDSPHDLSDLSLGVLDLGMGYSQPHHPAAAAAVQPPMPLTHLQLPPANTPLPPLQTPLPQPSPVSDWSSGSGSGSGSGAGAGAGDYFDPTAADREPVPLMLQGVALKAESTDASLDLPMPSLPLPPAPVAGYHMAMALPPAFRAPALAQPQPPRGRPYGSGSAAAAAMAASAALPMPDFDVSLPGGLAVAMPLYASHLPMPLPVPVPMPMPALTPASIAVTVASMPQPPAAAAAAAKQQQQQQQQRASPFAAAGGRTPPPVNAAAAAPTKGRAAAAAAAPAKRNKRKNAALTESAPAQVQAPAAAAAAAATAGAGAAAAGARVPPPAMVNGQPVTTATVVAPAGSAAAHAAAGAAGYTHALYGNAQFSPTALVAGVAGVPVSPLSSTGSRSPKVQESAAAATAGAAGAGAAAGKGTSVPGGANAASSGNSSGDERDDPADPTQDKRQKRLMRNRASAQLSRERKKMQLKKLELQLKALSTTNESLTSQIAALANENHSLKARLLNLETGAGSGSALISVAPAGAFMGARLQYDHDGAAAPARRYSPNRGGHKAKRARVLAPEAQNMVQRVAHAFGRGVNEIGRQVGVSAPSASKMRNGMLLLAFVFGVTIFGTFLHPESVSHAAGGPNAAAAVGTLNVLMPAGVALEADKAVARGPRTPSAATIVELNDDKQQSDAAVAKPATVQPLASAQAKVASAATAATTATATATIAVSPRKVAAAAAAAAAVPSPTAHNAMRRRLLDAFNNLTESYADEEMPPSTTAVSDAQQNAPITADAKRQNDGAVRQSDAVRQNDGDAKMQDDVSDASDASGVDARVLNPNPKRGTPAATGTRLASGAYRNANDSDAEMDARVERRDGVWNTDTSAGLGVAGGSGQLKVMDASAEAGSLRRGIQQVLGLEPSPTAHAKADGLAAYRQLLSGNASFERGQAYLLLTHDAVHIPSFKAAGSGSGSGAAPNGSSSASDSDSVATPNSPPHSPPPLLPPSPVPAAHASPESYDRSLTAKRIKLNANASDSDASNAAGVFVPNTAGSTSAGDVINLWIPTSALRQNVTYDKGAVTASATVAGVATGTGTAARVSAAASRDSGVTQVTCSIQSIRPVLLSN